MLRASAKATDSTIDLEAVTSDAAGDGGIPHGTLLIAFATAALGDDAAALDDVRDRVRGTLGEAALVDASGVIANYSALDRVADATGIPLESDKEANTVELRARLGIDEFARRKDQAEP